MPRFKKRPVVIEAVKWTGSNTVEIVEFTGGKGISFDEDGGLSIATLEGTHKALFGDWVIKGVKGEFYPCKPDIFDMTYEPA